MDKCSICGSTRVLEGPGYAPDEVTCLDCGSQFNREIRAMPTEEEVKESVKEAVPFPVGGFDSPEAAAAHLKKLQEQAMKIAGTPIVTKKGVGRKNKIQPPQVPMVLKDEFPHEMVWMGIHIYCRPGESWQSALSTAKGEKELRNENVRIWAHNHHFGQACENNCKEI